VKFKIVLIKSWIFVSREFIRNPLTHVPEVHPIPKNNKEDDRAQQAKILYYFHNTSKQRYKLKHIESGFIP